ncbi:armadillo-like helical domain-containing protein 4 [Peromyscus californicus insignis]|uniref:armadillo-like helical domain-containing protein 4 n=1 Tax=Peromyscus californicus insignis TaxID=564181 RepID=UPI0022A66E4D|nr:armadillo-like helical domain-containing protein 4 [Peromyscus californicus insignis]
MSRPTLMHSSVAFCSILFLPLATQCLAFQKVEKMEVAHAYAEKEQSQKMDTGDQENISFAPKSMPQQMSSEAPMVLSAGSSVMQLNKVTPVPTSSTHSILEGITDVTRDFLKYVDNQLFPSESQEAVSLGNTPSSYINTKEMITANSRPEELKTDAVKKTTAFPGADSTADTEPGGERPSEKPADNAQTTITIHLVATPEDILNIDPTADSLLRDLKVTVSVSTAVPVSSVPSDEWDDTKFESVSQTRIPDSGDSAETQVITEPPHRMHESYEGIEGSPASTKVTKVSSLRDNNGHSRTRQYSVTQRHTELPRGCGEPEEDMLTPFPVSADVDATELSGRWESLATPASTTVVPLPLEVTSSMGDTITGPNVPIPILDSPMMPPVMTVEALTNSQQSILKE